jgi:hypothetical protein
LACPLILAALAEFDREMIVEGTMEGLACARTPRTSPARRWERRAAGGRRGAVGVWDWNVASRRVLEKLGFRETGRVEPGSAYGHSVRAVREL